jgi:nitrilase
MTAEKRAKFKVAAVQTAPVFLNREATVEKACALIIQAGREGASLVVFPEAFIPTYPHWIWKIPAGQNQFLSELYAELVANAVTIPGDATDRLCRAAKEAGVYVVMGMNECNAEASHASLYCTLLYIDDQGQIIGKHRKLVPSGGERMIWAQGDGSMLDVYDTPFGQLSGLICWENYMPLARYALYAQGVEIYVASTFDNGEAWLATLRHIAREGRVFVIGCCMAMRKDDIPDHFEFKQKFYADEGEWINEGDSAIINPDGEIIAGPMHEKEDILYAEIDPSLILGRKWKLDVAGHYGRPDVFELIIHSQARQMVTFEDNSLQVVE